MKTCATCRHRHYMGDCLKIVRATADDESAIAEIMVDGEKYGATVSVSLLTHKGFGCVLHEEKEG